MNSLKRKLFPFLFLGLCLLALPLRAQEVVVSAAASLKDVLGDLAPLCLKSTGVTLSTNLAASGVLAQQIKSGAPVDIFISADDETMDGLDKAGLIQTDSRTTLVTNTLVFVVPVDSKLKIDAPAALTADTITHIGIGDPKTVPAGHYATTYLEKMKVLTAIQSKLVPLDNVRTVLAHVAAGNVDVGAVYRTDALSEKKVREVFAATGPDAPVIHYPIAIIKASKAAAAAEKVREFLLSDAARAVFTKYGFALPEKPAPAKAATPAAAASSAK